MKKQYSLDYTIQRDTDRVAAIKQILDNLEFNPSPTQLEQMGSYILYGKDQDGYNAVQRGEVTDGHKRYGTYKKKEDKNLSLDSLMANPFLDQQILKPANQRHSYTNPKPTINHPKYDKTTGALLDIGDADIPGMPQLWQQIAHLQHVLAVNQGKIAPDESTTIVPDSYRIYQLKHWLADLRKHQYYLKDAYKPTIHFLATDHPRTQYVDWSGDCFYWISHDQWQRRTQKALTRSISKNIADYEVAENGQIKWLVRQHNFDWQNPKHVRALINNYGSFYQYLRERFQTYGRALIFDFERYREMCHFSQVREHLIDMKIARASYPDMVAFLEYYYGLTYNENYLSNIFAKEIPNAFATVAKKNRLIVETPLYKQKICRKCGQAFPRSTLFFGVNNNRVDHFSVTCKQCEKKKRIARGDQYAYDKRSKDPTLHEMQGRKA